MRFVRLIRAFSLTIAGGLFLLGIALAQQSPSAMALQINAAVGNMAQTIEMQTRQIQQLRAQLDAANARVKALEDKYEPKTPPAAPK